MRLSVKILLSGILLSIITGCRTSDKSTKYTLSLKDSLYWERKSVDTLFHLKGSYLPLVILPKDLQEGDTLKKKKDQANLEIVKKGDTLYIEASCDSLSFRVNFLEEKLSYVSKENQELQEQVKKAPSRTAWFSYGFMSCLTILLFIFVIKKIRRIFMG